MKELQRENARLKRMLADEMLGKELLKEALEKKGVKVIYVTDPDSTAIKEAIDEYVEALQEGDVGMVFFAGRGCEYRKVSRLLVRSVGEKPNILRDSVDVLVLINRLGTHKCVSTCARRS